MRLLCKGFPDRTEAYWHAGLQRQARRPMPEGYPPYGYLLEAGAVAVGVLLTLYSQIETHAGPRVRCNLSSWYIEPAFRSQGVFLEKVATRQQDMTYLDITPAPHTWPIIEARGFRRYCNGQMLAFPLFGLGRRGVSVRLVQAGDPLTELCEGDAQIVRDHVSYGCLGLVCEDENGARPLIFQRRTIGLFPNVKRFGQVPCAQLVFAHDMSDVVRFSGAIGRVLLRAARTFLVVLDATGPVRGLPGWYFEGRAPKYVRGPAAATLGDLAYSELVIFGP